MVKVLQILICSEFGLFKRNDSNELGLTYNFPPKTQILGLLGSVIGLSGYSEGKSKPEFYEKLKWFKIAIQPLGENKENLMEAPKKTIITYNNYHGYGSMEEGGILQVREQILIRPTFRIFVKGEGEEYIKLKSRLENQEYFYTPYFGKNEFLAEIHYEGEKEISKITDGEVSIQSIFLKEYAKYNIAPTRENPTRAKLIIADDYPVSFDENYIYQKKVAIYADGVQKPDYDKMEKDGFEICEVNQQPLFFI